jgi:Flp pilus assembly protein TadG
MTKITQRIEQPHRFKGILSRLRKDTSGVALYIYAIGLVPIVASAGIGFDMGRAYLVRSKLQQACDAGAIAGRRSMSGVSIKTEDKQEAERFFRANFQDGLLGSKPIASYASASPNKIDVWQSQDGQLYMAAKTQVPTTLVSQFVGDKDVDVSVRCLGEEFFVNTDIMLVLDTTGSMNCAVGALPTCGSSSEPSTAKINTSKMSAMRVAVKQLYSDLRPIQTKLEQKGLRMRFGWVNYAMNVNVGHLILGKSANYIRPEYQYINESGIRESTPSKFLTTDASAVLSKTSTKWDGCIEERKTVDFGSSTTSIPSGALDMDIAAIPNDTGAGNTTLPDSRWALKPYKSGFTSYPCPKPAMAMQTWTSQAAFDAEIDKIRDGVGGTHHDVGMIWGARMVSDKGIFGADNPNSHNKVEVKKVIVFMTDGGLDIAGNAYSSYGVMNYTKRTTSSTSSSTQKAVHRKRLQLMCNRAREQEIDIWIILLDKSGPKTRTADEQASFDVLKNCAAVPSQMIYVDNTAALSDAFKSISDKVGNLRVGE